MVQFLSITFFLGFLQFLLGFSKVTVFLCHSVLKISEPWNLKIITMVAAVNVVVVLQQLL